MSYVTADELIKRMQLSNVTADMQATAQDCVDAATQEIDSHLGWLDAAPVLTPEQTALVRVVNLDRAAEHWRLTPFGALGQGPELPALVTARDSWYRHGRKLASLETEWGVG